MVAKVRLRSTSVKTHIHLVIVLSVVNGNSIPLVVSWIIGDIPKLVFFIIGNSPVQFISCAVFQIIVDLFIIWQIYHYRGMTYGAPLSLIMTLYQL